MSFVSTAVSGVVGANGAKDAAAMQAAGAADANRVAGEQYGYQKDLYNQQRADIEPYRASGVQALSDMADPNLSRSFTSADFQKDPGYDFRMQEGQKALERSAAAKGGLGSGGTMKALSRYGQDYASNEYGNAYNRFTGGQDRRFGQLSQRAGMGQTAVGQLNNAAQWMGGMSANYANQYDQNTTGAANAQAAGRIGEANAWTGAIQNAQKKGTDMAAMAATGGASAGMPKQGGGR